MGMVVLITLRDRDKLGASQSLLRFTLLTLDLDHAGYSVKLQLYIVQSEVLFLS